MERSIYEAIYEASESKPEEKSGKEAPETATSSEEGDMDTFPEDEFQPSESEEASEEDEEEEEEEGQLRRPKRSVKKRVEIIEDDSASEPENDEDDDWGSEEVGDDDDDDDVEESWEDEDDPDSDDSIRDRSKKQPSGGRRRQRQQLSPRSPSNSGLILPESIKSIKELKSVQIPLSRLDPKVIAEAIVRNCPECQESFKGLKALEEHVQTMHIKLEPQDCDHCKMRFLIPEAYQVKNDPHTCDTLTARPSEMVENTN